MRLVEIHLNPTIPAGIVPAEACKHQGPHRLVIGGRLVKGGTTCDATICLACGTIEPVAAQYRHYWHALNAFWAKFGWHKTIGPRLSEFADVSTGAREESFFALIHGLAPEELSAYMEAA